MEVSPETKLAAEIKRRPVADELRVERLFETGRMGREAVAKVYETLLPRVRRVLSGPSGLSSSADVRSDVKESC